MTRIEKTIDIDVPVGTVYNQWTQFEEFPRFMEGIKEVRQLDATHLHWRAEIGGRMQEWTAEITHQIPDRTICWRSTSGTQNAGEVWFQSLSPFKTRVTLCIDYTPRNLLEDIGDVIGMVSHRVEGDLRRFKEFTEERGTATGAWRGEVKIGHVREPVRTHPPLAVGKAMDTKTIPIEITCPACNMPRQQWSNQGTLRAGVTYCCDGCATGTGCTCQHSQRAAA